MTDEATVYPRTYEYSAKGKLLWSLFSMVFLLPGLAGAGLFAVTAVRPEWAPFLKFEDGGTALIVSGICLIPAGLGLACLISSLRGELVLYPDRLEYTGLFARRVVRRDEIAETRNLRHQYGFLILTLVLKTANSRKVTITDFGKADDLLAQWFHDIPNAEATAEQARNQALLENPAFGATEEAREKAVNGQIKIINALGYVAQGSGLWAFVYPHPYSVCIAVLAGIPILAFLMMMLSGGRWALTNDKLSGRIPLDNLIYLPVCALVLRAFMDVGIIDWKTPLVWAASLTVMLMVVVAGVERRFNPKIAVGAVFLYFAYAWAGLMQANNLLDSATPSIHRVRVLDMRVSDGRTTMYYLDLPPWGPYRKDNEYSVARDLYDHVHKGDTVCVYLYPGALGWANYVVDVCPSAKP